MKDVSIKEFSEKLDLSVDKLLTQMEASGIKGKKAGDSINDDEKVKLLGYLKGLHGEDGDAPKQVTLRRTQTMNLSAGSGRDKRNVKVEVRKKRTYVKKEDAVEESVVEEVVVPVEAVVETKVEAPVVTNEVKSQPKAPATKADAKSQPVRMPSRPVVVTEAPLAAKEDHSKAAKKAQDQKHHETRKVNDGTDGPKTTVKKPAGRGAPTGRAAPPAGPGPGAGGESCPRGKE